MADTGSPYNLRYPVSSSPVDIHTDIKNLADDTETALDTKLNKTGGTLTGALSGTTLSLSGNITVSATGTAQITAASSTGYARFNADRASGQYGALYVLTGGSTRWIIGGNSTEESGANAGTNFAVKAYDDSGVHINDHLLITRSTGKVHLGQVGATAGLELGTSGPRMMSGTGSPESVVTAPVGSIWFQSDSTVGVTHWRKATGSGNTGWVVMSGDTGWRKIVSWTGGVQDGTNQIGTINTSQYSMSGTGSIYIRRINDYVEWWIHGALTKTNSSVHKLFTVDNLIPSGFRADGGATYGISAPLTREIDFFASYGIGDTPAFDAVSAGVTLLYDSCRHFTANPWPTSLPGVAGT